MTGLADGRIMCQRPARVQPLFAGRRFLAETPVERPGSRHRECVRYIRSTNSPVRVSIFTRSPGSM
jgi:hypothetical protein